MVRYQVTGDRSQASCPGLRSNFRPKAWFFSIRAERREPKCQSRPCSHHDFRFLLCCVIRLFLPDGQGEGHGSAVIQNTVDADFAIMTAHVRLADTEAEAGAATALGSEKRFENMSQN